MTGKEDQLAPARRPAKSAAAFRTISEVASDLDVPTHVLRFWEGKFPSIRPLKRGGGRRYYRPEDVELLRRIRGLLYDEGYTIKGAQRLVREAGGRAGGERAAAPQADTQNPAGPAAPAAKGSNGHGRPLASEARQELAEILGDLRRLRDILGGAVS